MNTSGQFLQPWLGSYAPTLYAASVWWTIIGFAGNILFGSRFILQWLESERKNELVVPAYFWHLSFWGSVLNLIYAFHLDSAPLILGVAALPFVYARNLVLLGRGATTERAPKAERASASGVTPPKAAAAGVA
jgi:lipid-A-disaccharide synthase-like uncharacterized protein